MLRTCLLAFALVTIAHPVAAEIDNEKADRLFSEAVALRDKHPAEACAKFEQALQYNPQAISTRLNVALCDERLGRIASAVDKLREVADRAREQKQDEYLKVAEQRLAALEPDVPFLAITFASAPAPETKVLIDDRVVPMERLARLPTDPGERVIVVTAPGRVAFRKTIPVLKRTTTPLVVPALARNTNPPRRTLGVIGVAGGGAAIAASVTVALIAKGRYDDAIAEECDPDTLICSAEGARRVESARTLGNVCTAVTVVGVGAVLAGAYLWWRTPRATERKVSVVPQLAPGSAGLTAIGRF